MLKIRDILLVIHAPFNFDESGIIHKKGFVATSVAAKLDPYYRGGVACILCLMVKIQTELMLFVCGGVVLTSVLSCIYFMYYISFYFNVLYCSNNCDEKWNTSHTLLNMVILMDNKLDLDSRFLHN